MCHFTTHLRTRWSRLQASTLLWTLLPSHSSHPGSCILKKAASNCGCFWGLLSFVEGGISRFLRRPLCRPQPVSGFGHCSHGPRFFFVENHQICTRITPKQTLLHSPNPNIRKNSPGIPSCHLANTAPARERGGWTAEKARALTTSRKAKVIGGEDCHSQTHTDKYLCICKKYTHIYIYIHTSETIWASL